MASPDTTTNDVTLPETGRVGLWSGGFDSLGREELTDTMARLDDTPFGALWFGEAYGREAFTHAQVLLSASTRLTVATGVANIWVRDPMAANAAARTPAQWHDGRFLLGLGVSHRPLVSRMRGHAYERPLAAMREYLTAMDSARFVAAGQDEPRPPRVLAALAPGILAASRDLADGAHTYLVTPEHTEQARATLGTSKLLAVEVSCVLTEDRDVWRERARMHLELYTGLPNYTNNWKRLGFDEDDFVRGGSPALQSALVCFGLDHTLKTIDEHLAAGADHVCVQVIGPSKFATPGDDWWRLAEALG